jgi:putative redox protein
MKLSLKRVDRPYVFEVENESGLVTHLDATPAIGGKNAGFRPMEMLAASLAGCAAIDILRILEKKHISSERFSIDIEAKRTDRLPSVFEWIHLSISLDPSIDEAIVRKVVDLTLENYCSVAASLNKQIAIRYTINEQLP